MAVFPQGTWPRLYLELSSSQKMIMEAGRWYGKKKKSVPEEEFTCFSSFTSDFYPYAFYRSS